LTRSPIVLTVVFMRDTLQEYLWLNKISCNLWICKFTC